MVCAGPVAALSQVMKRLPRVESTLCFGWSPILSTIGCTHIHCVAGSVEEGVARRMYINTITRVIVISHHPLVRMNVAWCRKEDVERLNEALERREDTAADGEGPKLYASIEEAEAYIQVRSTSTSVTSAMASAYENSFVLN